MLSEEILSKLIVSEMAARGFNPESSHSMVIPMAEAFAAAAVAHIQSNAEVIVERGSSAGTYKVK